jgi:cob(I)alamin adenosyltransferase
MGIRRFIPLPHEQHHLLARERAFLADLLADASASATEIEATLAEAQEELKKVEAALAQHEPNEELRLQQWELRAELLTVIDQCQRQHPRVLDTIHNCLERVAEVEDQLGIEGDN